MDYSDEELYGIVEELDAMASEASSKDTQFIADILDRGLQRFSPPQRQWILDMKARYLR